MEAWVCDKCGLRWEVLRGKCLCGGNILPQEDKAEREQNAAVGAAFSRDRFSRVAEAVSPGTGGAPCK